MKVKSGILLIFTTLVFLQCSRDKNSPLVYTGIIEGTAVEVPALTGGQIIALRVDTGDEVHLNQILGVVDTLELTYQRENLKGVHEEVLNQKAIASTQYNRAKKDQAYVQEKYNRFLDLLKNQSVPQQTVDDLQNQLQNAEAAVNAAGEQVQSVEAKLTQVEAQLKSLQKKIKDATITSPLTGTVTAKYYEEREAIATFSPLVEVIDLNEVWVKIYVSEKMLPHIRISQEVKIKPDGTDQELKGTIVWINSKAEFTPKTILTPETRTSLVYAVKVIIANKNRILKQGMPVEVLVERE
jgi:HlyD family secretion protein